MKIYITGHISPDLDAIAAAVEYAEFLKQSKRYEDAEIIPVRPGDPNKETQFVFNKFGVPMPKSLDELTIDPSDKFILVDHNEESQRHPHPKVTHEQIIEIVDHHKVNINFPTPVRINVQPVGSTSTIIYELFEIYKFQAPQNIEGLMLCGILSDTVGLKSSTTTGVDSTIAHKIVQNNGWNMEELIFELFKAKSDLTGLSAEQIVNKDVKVFEFGTKKVFIGQVETVEPDKVIAQKDSIIKALADVRAKQGVAQAYLFVTDILKLNSHAICSTDDEMKVLEKAFTAVSDDHIFDVGPVISRKKDIAPAIEKALQS